MHVCEAVKMRVKLLLKIDPSRFERKVCCCSRFYRLGVSQAKKARIGNGRPADTRFIAFAPNFPFFLSRLSTVVRTIP